MPVAGFAVGVLLSIYRGMQGLSWHRSETVPLGLQGYSVGNSHTLRTSTTTTFCGSPAGWLLWCASVGANADAVPRAFQPERIPMTPQRQSDNPSIPN